VGAVPANHHGYQGFKRYSALLAASPAPALAGGAIHRPGNPQRLAVLGFAKVTVGGDNTTATAVLPSSETSRIQQFSYELYGVDEPNEAC
jgi:hypothetical protein